MGGCVRKVGFSCARVQWALDRVIWRALLDVCLEIYTPPPLSTACSLSLAGEAMLILASSLLQPRYDWQGRALNPQHLE